MPAGVGLEVPPAFVRPGFAPSPLIIETALGFFVRPWKLDAKGLRGGRGPHELVFVRGVKAIRKEAEAASPMIKPIQIALAPTRNRPLNMFLGVVLALVSLLLFLAIASYHVTDPSLNTSLDPANPQIVANWVGPFGAYLGDLSLQALGITAFLFLCGWGWWRGDGCARDMPVRRGCGPWVR